MTTNQRIPTTPDQVTLRRRGTGVTAHDPLRSAGGYTLFAGQTAEGRVDLIDCDGKTAHRWQMPVRAGRDAVILPNGNLGYNGSHATSAALYPAWDLWHGGDFYEATPQGDIVWRHEDIFHHHDAQWLASGNLLYTVAAPLPADKAARVCGGDPRKDGADGVIQSDIVREVNRKGETVWEWRIWDHLDPADFPIHTIFDRRHWPMINGLAETRDGLILMSLRTTSGVIAVDRTTGKVVWHVGADAVAQQHTPVEMESGAILVFDNGNLRDGSTSPFSRALEFDPKTGETVWAYQDTSLPMAFFSPYMGSCQRLWNGNTFICESAFGRLFEVTPDGAVVWEYVIPDFAAYPAPLNTFIGGSHNSCFRAHRYRGEAIAWL
ncbi:aryl sulfotransferase [Pseudooceanicola sediminis]|uniref:Aryl sulfotransferase n=1 Tax=Pseudooceanicola sediminis TaxID=2211117 RepID=A0A399IWD4_9RHOB|nr:aryl-sulfate sulfotransferase [Pseudooceanicola sediminis]KAA2314979.1 PQQ-binding-like beta-propeller repeat protein [Puniceibacterium sp. HSS470]RII37351.1 aryl sulfotransferase [Pseudooceanicola sediminis]|tara:strand:- start:33913 stop:35046 length:1134 start_codon:yes stop_codon:yes gene_type:complete